MASAEVQCKPVKMLADNVERFRIYVALRKVSPAALNVSVNCITYSYARDWLLDLDFGHEYPGPH